MTKFHCILMESHYELSLCHVIYDFTKENILSSNVKISKKLGKENYTHFQVQNVGN